MKIFQLLFLKVLWPFLQKLSTQFATSYCEDIVFIVIIYSQPCLIINRPPIWYVAISRLSISKLFTKISKFWMRMATSMRIVKSHVKEKILQIKYINIQFNSKFYLTTTLPALGSLKNLMKKAIFQVKNSFAREERFSNLYKTRR